MRRMHASELIDVTADDASAGANDAHAFHTSADDAGARTYTRTRTRAGRVL